MHPFSRKKAGPRRFPLILAGLLFMAAGLLGGCAENRSNLLPGKTVDEISTNLDRVQELADSGDCLGAIDAAQKVTRQIEGLGTAVDATLRRSLRDGASRLVLAIQKDCQQSETLSPPADTTLPEVTTSPDSGVEAETPGTPAETTGGTGPGGDRKQPSGSGETGSEGPGTTGGGATGGTGGTPEAPTGGTTGGGTTGGTGNGNGTGTGGVELPGG